MKKMPLNSRIWYWYVDKFDLRGKVMRKRDYAFSFLIRPIKTTLHLFRYGHGYDWQTDTWNIHGIKFTSEFFTALAKESKKDGGITLTFKNINGIIEVSGRK